METPILKPWASVDIEAQLQDELTHKTLRANVSDPRHIDAMDNQRVAVEGNEDAADTGGILVFAILFSTTVAIFVIESYKMLSPSLDDAIMAIPTQLSRQLDNISSGTPLQNVSVQNDSPFKPTASTIRTNIMWFLSLILSLAYTLSAISTQQLARKYREVAGLPRKPYKNAYILQGSRAYRVMAMMPTLLHLSIFLFIVGLIDFLLSINKTVAFCTLCYLSAFSFTCSVFATLPHPPLDNLSRPPLPEYVWRKYHILVPSVSACLGRAGGSLHDFLSPIWNRNLQATGSPRALTTWWGVLKGYVPRQQQKWPADGLLRSVEMSTTSEPWIESAHAFSQTLSTLDQDQDIENLVARIPGILDTRAVPGASSTVLSSMDIPSDRSTPNPILGSRIHDLLNTCIPDASPLTEESRRERLRICLKTLWCCGRAYNRLGNSVTLPHYVHAVFASPEMTRRIQNERDLAARTIGRCFVSLVVKKLASDINARSAAGLGFSGSELARLSTILGTGNETMGWLDRPGTIALANIISLLPGEFDTLFSDKAPSDVLRIFQETLVIVGTELLRADMRTSADLPVDLVAQFRGIYSKFANVPAPEWLRVQLTGISRRLPPIPCGEGQ
ncbi:hypothetical protein BC826DRAFT_967233 [Russula brevipes]|nr:hypothetical protein BC826DRAFT_967233 [Russula brevipes]